MEMIDDRFRFLIGAAKDALDYIEHDGKVNPARPLNTKEWVVDTLRKAIDNAEKIR